MKKTLIALATLAATGAFAQSTVTISGLVDTGFVATDNPSFTSGSTANPDTKGLGANGTATTNLTIAGSEDLGGGLKANFRFQLTPDFINGNGVEGGLNAAASANVGNGQEAFVGLSGGFGTVKMGRVNSNALDAWGIGSVFGTAIGSGYGSSGNIFTRYSATATATSQTAPTRFNGAIRYESPVVNGFSGSVLMVPKANGANGETVTDVGLRYSKGPLNVMVASQEVKAAGTAATNSFLSGGLTANTSNKLNVVSANYNFGAVTLLGAYWTEKQGTTVNQKGNMIGARYVMGATTLMASMGNSNDGTTANVDKKIAGIGADYALSKRTALYARMDSRDANSNDATSNTANGTTKRTAIGVRHTF